MKNENCIQIAKISEIIFMGKQHIDWDSVEKYALKYLDDVYIIAYDGEQIYIDRKFVDEFTSSIDTKRLRGASAKAKANAIQIVKELLEISNNPRHIPNYEEKHAYDAKFGWYRYDSRFSIPIYENKRIIRYNVFKVTMLIRHSGDGKKYLYDMVNIKKETEYTA